MNTFDITLLTNSSILKPVDAVATGGIVNGTAAAVTVLTKCIGGIGMGCASTDSKDTLHYTISSSYTALGPATGLLFTATYSIVGASQFSTNSPIGFQKGCSVSSIGNGVCILILSGSVTPVPETAQAAKFTNQAYFDLQTAPSVPSLAVPRGSSDASLLLNVTSINGFSGSVTLVADVSPPGPIVKVLQTSVMVNATNPSSPLFGCCDINVTIVANVMPGNYTVTFTGTSSTIPSNTLKLPLIVPKPDFAITVSPSALTFNVSSSASSVITLTSLANFAGIVNLTVTPTAGLNVSLLRNPLTVSKGGSNSTVLTLKATTGGFYGLTITGASGPLIQAARLRIAVLDFTMWVFPGALVITQGAKSTEDLIFGSTQSLPYNVTVTISKISIQQITSNGQSLPSAGITVDCSPTKLNLTSYGLIEPTVTSACLVNGIQVGNYTVTIEAASGTVTHSVTFPVLMLITQPDFSISVMPSSLSMQQGSNASSTVSLFALNGFSGNVTLTAIVLPSGVALRLTTYTVFLSNNATSVLTVLTTSSTSVGGYFVTVRGTTLGITHSVPVTVTVTLRPQLPQPFFTLTASPASLSIPQGGSAVSTIALTSFNNFTGTITLAGSISSGVEIRLSPVAVILRPSNVNSSALTVLVGATVSAGIYELTLTGTSGITSQIRIPITVAGPPSLTVVAVNPNAVANLTETSGPVTFSVDVTNSPSINSFQVILYYNTTVLGRPSVDYSGTVLGTNAQLEFLCIDNVPVAGRCFSTDGFGVITILVVLIGQSTSPINSGLLFHVTFNIIGTGLGQVHIYSAHLNSVAQTGASDVPLSTKDGYFTNLDCPKGSGTACKPPIVAIGVTPQVPAQGAIVSFNATVIEQNANAAVEFFKWDWGDGTLPIYQFTNFSQPIQHVFIAASFGLGTGCAGTGACFVTLSVANNETVVWMRTIIVHIAPVQDFSISARPISLNIQQGSSAIIFITVINLDGFNGSVELGATVLPFGPAAALSDSAVTFQRSFAFAYLILNIPSSTPPGIYAVTIGARALSTDFVQTAIIHVSVTIPPADFSITTSVSYLTITAGSTTNSTINILSVNGFTGNIILKSAVSPAVPSASPLVELQPNAILLASGGSGASHLLILTSITTPAQTYIVTVVGTNGTLTHSAIITVQVFPAPDIPPIASFTFSPSNPLVGQSVVFDASSSHDPDGFVQQYSWNFGDGTGLFISSTPFINHSFSSPGNYTVSLTVEDNARLTGSKNTVIPIRVQPAHDISIFGVSASPSVAVSTETVRIQIQLRNDGLNNETVTVTAYDNGQVIRTAKGIFLEACTPNRGFCFGYNYAIINWDTTGVAVGNYTISASASLSSGEVDPTPSDNNYTDGRVTILPAPVITINPNTGAVGTKVQAQGSGFQTFNQYGYQFVEPIWVTFDNNFLGESFAQNGSFTFTFDVIEAQPGLHQVIAQDLNNGARASTSFTVVSEPTGHFTVTINTGTVYFPGDTVVAYVLTSFNGVPIGTGVQLQILILKPDGTNNTLAAIKIGNGLYRANYNVPTTIPLGTYLLLANAHKPGPSDASSTVSFEVKLSWLSSNARGIAGAATITGLIGLVTLAWRKGYLRRRETKEIPTLF
jgi:uncharacterized membrane protein